MGLSAYDVCARARRLLKFSHELEVVFDVAVLFVVLLEEAIYNAFAHTCWVCGGAGDVEEEVHWFLVGAGLNCVVVD